MPRKKASRKTKPRKRKKSSSLETKLEHFGEEMGKVGSSWSRHYYKTFGIFGPFVTSLIGILILTLFVLIINAINFSIGSSILAGISAFFLTNIGMFFMVFLFFSYVSYFSKAFPKESTVWSPLIAAFGIVIVLWVIIQAINIVNLSLGIPVLSMITFHMGRSLLWIFTLVVILGYIIVLVKTNLEGPVKPFRKEHVSARRTVYVRKRGETPRIYRSQKERILGGVCGGIAEHLGIDPVLIRLLWVVVTFAWGFGILLYIIAWIIIPRNPYHRWEE